MAEQVPLIDTGNGKLAETPAEIAAGIINGPGGRRIGLTIRTASTTLTVMMDKASAKNWASIIDQVADQFSDNLDVAPGQLTPGGLFRG